FCGIRMSTNVTDCVSSIRRTNARKGWAATRGGGAGCSELTKAAMAPAETTANRILMISNSILGPAYFPQNLTQEHRSSGESSRLKHLTPLTPQRATAANRAVRGAFDRRHHPPPETIGLH